MRHSGWPVGLAGLLALAGCDRGPALSSTTEVDAELPNLGPLLESGPRLGALLDRTPVHERPSKKSRELGYLHAGATVARSEKSLEASDCIDGWYAVWPRGYVCTEKSATTDLAHPTLAAMALAPSFEKELPYVYARTTKVTSLFNRSSDQGVELGGRLAKSTVLAIVGSWTAADESREPQLLGLRMNGQFVRAEDLEAASGSAFAGVELNEQVSLPLAFVVRRGVQRWSLEEPSPKKVGEVAYHERVELSGRFRTVGEDRFYLTCDGSWVRHKEVTVLLPRHQLPDFAVDGQRWLDISVVTGSAIAYEGKKPVFATLVSVGRDRLGDPKTSASTALGTFGVIGKHVTRRANAGSDEPLLDAPWAMELESGQWLQASPRHDRFGIEHTDGDIEISPADGARLWKWLGPELPGGWHGLAVDEAALAGAPRPLVIVRK
ncbi:MAG TPA: L,D-transpeptidase [Polyangiaceae bacterium]|nr:L,D-transpeptidase [Polyangiaceae bacterium]